MKPGKTIRLSPEAWAKLDKLCQLFDRSQSSMLEILIKEAAKKNKVK